MVCKACFSSHSLLVMRHQNRYNEATRCGLDFGKQTVGAMPPLLFHSKEHNVQRAVQQTIAALDGIYVLHTLMIQPVVSEDREVAGLDSDSTHCLRSEGLLWEMSTLRFPFRGHKKSLFVCVSHPLTPFPCNSYLSSVSSLTISPCLLFSQATPRTPLDPKQR